MDRSIFLARLLGPTFAAIAFGILINLGMYESMIAEALHPGILFYLSGLLSLLAGLAIINLHNTWYADWRVIITVLGWLMTIGGIIRVVLPQIAMVPRHVADGMRRLVPPHHQQRCHAMTVSDAVAAGLRLARCRLAQWPV